LGHLEFMTLGINYTQHNYNLSSECRDVFIAVLNVVMVSVVILNVAAP
jgi:hypothetical protein